MTRLTCLLMLLLSLACTSEPPVCYEANDARRPNGPHLVRDSSGQCVRVESIDSSVQMDSTVSGDAELADGDLENHALLSNLEIYAPASLGEVFASTKTAYTVTAPYLSHRLEFVLSAHEGTTIDVNGAEAPNGQLIAVSIPAGESNVEISVSAPGRASSQYQLHVTRADAIQAASYFKASNSEAEDVFGGTVAITRDWLAVGAVFEASSADTIDGNQNDNQSPGAGAVYVFKRSEESWKQSAYIKPSSAEVNFGRAVTLSGDSLAVGAVDRVYIFRFDGDKWVEEASIRPENFEAGDDFGFSLALHDDTVVVGAPEEDSNATSIGGNADNNDADGAGAAYVFRRKDGSWREEAYIKGSKVSQYNSFGHAVAIENDTMVVTADGENVSSSGAGAAYIFGRTGEAWEERHRLTAPNPGEGYRFGFRVALAGDLLIVGSINESSSATGIDGDQANKEAEASGAVYVFRNQGATWEREAYIKASNTDLGDNFGHSLSADGPFIAVGAQREASNSPGIDGDQLNNARDYAGATYLFEKRQDDWKQVHYIKSPIPAEGNVFGQSVALGHGTLAVGELREDRKAKGVDSPTNGELRNSGAVFTFE